MNPSPQDNSVLIRFGVSFLNSEQACSNAETEVPSVKPSKKSSAQWDWNSVQGTSQGLWENVLQRIEIDTKKENSTVVELLYSSVRRSSSSKYIRIGLEHFPALSLCPRSSEPDR